jgi:hypothetical protein
MVFAKAENTMQKSVDSSVKAYTVPRWSEGVISSLKKLASRF